MRTICKVMISIAAILIAGWSASEAADAGNNGLAFLKMDVDGRAAAMAGAYTALSSDASATFWNPAGLAEANDKSLSLMHNIWLADISQEFAALHFKTGKHNLAFSVNLMTIPGIEVRGERPTEESAGEVDAINFYAALSYARFVGSNWQFGMNAKYIYEKYYLEMAPGWAVDLGIKRKKLLSNLDFGLVVQNIGQMSELRNESSQLPLIVRTGIGYYLPYQFMDHNPLLAADVQYVNDEATYFRLGSDIGLKEYINLRGGLILGGDEIQFTTGFSLNVKTYHLDYAFVPFQYNLGNTHRISFGMQF